MKKHGLMKNNSGASLVMVLLAIMFVGIISAIALTITVGNNKSSKTTVRTSQNFYSSESILDDLEMYLKKLATATATEAYKSSLENLGAGSGGSTVQGMFSQRFANATSAKLQEIFNNPDNVDGATKEFKLAFLKSICYDRYDLDTFSDGDLNIPISIKYESVTTDSEGNVVLKGVVISYDDGTYQSSITTDITFKANYPGGPSTFDSSDEFPYDIDHYIIISGANVTTIASGSSGGMTGIMSGNYTGNVYAGNKIIINSNTDGVNLKAHYVIAGDDIIVDKGQNNASSSGVFTVEPINNDDILSKPGKTFSANIWAQDFKIYDGKFAGRKSGSLGVNTYLEGSLELNGNASEFSVAGTNFVGYSSYSGVVISSASGDTTKPKSSAIVLNGLGSKLDLQEVSNLTLAGTAYTLISNVEGKVEGKLDDIYSAYSGYDDPVGPFAYYTQGESITYRALQALYLIPGSMIAGVGHNPMTIAEYGSGVTVNVPVDMAALVDAYEPQHVRYVNESGNDKVYLFWRFKSTAAAVEYFRQVTSMDSRYFSGKDLSDKQIKMLSDKGGYVRLPSGTKTLKGNAVYYSNGLKSYSGEATDISVTGYSTTYGSLKGYASETKSNDGSSLINNMFGTKLSLVDSYDGSTAIDLRGPCADSLTADHKKEIKYEAKNKTHYTDESGNVKPDADQTEFSTTYVSKLQSMNYKLVLGHDIVWNKSFATNTTYVFIASNNVTITTTDNTNGFRGIIIAGGNVYLPDGLKMECMGMLSYVETIGTEAQPQKDVSEFKALLDVCVDGDSEKLLVTDSEGKLVEGTTINGNTLLRKIFNVAHTEESTTTENGSDFVTIITTDWKRN